MNALAGNLCLEFKDGVGRWGAPYLCLVTLL
jgi:hypothetical protein